jgi:dTDP-4-dehydrorhamnose reductase
MSPIREHRRPALWGGVECTVNRVGEAYFDQLERTGHADRISDLERFADLGLHTLRYPFLWERIAPHGLDRASWRWADERWQAMRQLGLQAIVGLVHHGSGPRHTNLLEDSFATGLAAYAGAFARRFPDAWAYTPVNEPCTTARFSALYGHWYPHRRTDRDFVRAMVIQCRATVLAMRAIRQVNPAALLVQTDDLGRTFSTPSLAYQADFQNERRWLAFDLLDGRVTRTHPLWDYLRWAGADEHDLQWFADHPCPPDVIGVNYYLTSDRFLDHRLDRYDASLHGGNGRMHYADTEAVRVRPEGLVGHEALLLEAYARARRPVALTEVHAGGAPDEQARWLRDGWRGAQRAAQRGANVAGVTAWALLGSFDWNCLVTRPQNCYETGAFDVRDRTPRLTDVGRLVRRLATASDDSTDDQDTTEGWWRRPERFLQPLNARDLQETR